MPVSIVTDSTSDIPVEKARGLGVSVIAQNVHFGEQTFKDNVTITPDDFYSMLVGSSELPKTSQASPGEFKELYDGLAEDSDGIVSIHVSSKLSGTWNSAIQGAAQTTAGCPIEVIDSGQASMGLGLAVVAAAQAASQGAGYDEVVSAAKDAVDRGTVHLPVRDAGVPPEGWEDRQSPGAAGFPSKNQAYDHTAGRRCGPTWQGANFLQGPDRAEEHGPRVRAVRGPGRDAQHHPGPGGGGCQ